MVRALLEARPLLKSVLGSRSFLSLKEIVDQEEDQEEEREELKTERREALRQLIRPFERKLCSQTEQSLSASTEVEEQVPAHTKNP